MAYAFNKLGDYLAGRRGPTGSSGPGAGGVAGGGINKGPAIPFGGGTKTGSNTAAPSGAVSTGREILDRNQGYTGEAVAGRITNPAQQEAAGYIGKTNADVGQFTGDTLNSAKTDLTNIGSTITSAAGGDSTAADTLRGYIAPKAPTPVTYQAPTAAPLTASEYSRGGNVGAYLQKQSGGKYTPGMGMIDQMAFNRGGGGAQVSQQLGNLNQSMNDTRDAAQTQANAVPDQVKALQDATAQSVRDAIAAKNADYQRIIDEQVKAEQDRLTGKAGSDKTAAIEALKTNPDIVGVQSEPGVLKDLSGFDFEKYLNPATNSVEYAPGEISQYNALQGILGGDLMTNPYVNSTSYAPDTGGLLNYLKGQVTGLPNKTPTLPDGSTGTSTPLPGDGANAPVQVPGYNAPAEGTTTSPVPSGITNNPNGTPIGDQGPVVQGVDTEPITGRQPVAGSSNAEQVAGGTQTGEQGMLAAGPNTGALGNQKQPGSTQTVSGSDVAGEAATYDPTTASGVVKGITGGLVGGLAPTIDDWFNSGGNTTVATPGGAGASTTTGASTVTGTGGAIVPPPVAPTPAPFNPFPGMTPEQVQSLMGGSTVTGTPPPPAPAAAQVSTAGAAYSPFGGNPEAAAAYNAKYGTNK